MEFWGVEVKSGASRKVNPGDGMVLHFTQASLGELKKEKGADSICLSVNVEGKKFVLGTLFTDKLPQQQFDLVFDKEFELSHNWKSGSVYFYGFKASNLLDDREFPEGDSDESESEEDIPITIASNGKSEPVNKQKNPAAAVKSIAAKDKDSKTDKQKVTIVEPTKDLNPQRDDESSDDDLMSEDDDENENDEDDSENESDESDEDTPKKLEPSKKRASESASKTPVPDKKAKVTPQKTDGKKGGGHVATPYPGKQAGKAQQTPKSGGSRACNSCNRNFGSDKALESHNKAKHGGGK